MIHLIVLFVSIAAVLTCATVATEHPNLPATPIAGERQAAAISPNRATRRQHAA
jgi:hypothetical protein